MKSIVLCERTLVQKSEDFNEIADNINEKTEEKSLNGTVGCQKLGVHVDNSQTNGNLIKNGDNALGISNKISENGVSEENKSVETDSLKDSLTDLVDISEQNNCGSLLSDVDKKDSDIENNLKNDSNSCGNSMNCPIGEIPDSNVDIDSSTDATGVIGDEGQVLQKVNSEVLSTEPENSNEQDSKELENTKSEESLEEVLLEIDENKENVKNDKLDDAENFSTSDTSNKSADGCEILVGDVQSILEKDCEWEENDMQTTEQGLTENDVNGLSSGCSEVAMPNGENVPNESEKEDGILEMTCEESATSETEENVEESMHIDLEEEADESKTEDNENEPIELDGGSVYSDTHNDTTDNVKENNEDSLSRDTAGNRKRLMSNCDKDDSATKRKKLSVEEEEKMDQCESENDKERNVEEIDCEELVEKSNEELEKSINAEDEITIEGECERSEDDKDKQNVVENVTETVDIDEETEERMDVENEKGGDKEEESLDKKEDVEEEKVEETSRSKTPPVTCIEDSENVVSKAEEIVETTKTVPIEDEDPKELNTSEKTEKKSSAKAITLSVLEKFRGTLKTLTRSDLEELIVQKLCEVITERSTVGELRRKAQALEQDQEKWKAKTQALNKQMREMEMVMKKYMNEVQKQIKDVDPLIVSPLKVTRSVGLQVSFYSNVNKQQKQSLPASSPAKPPQTVNVRNSKGSTPAASPSKSPAQYNLANQSVPVNTIKNKPSPVSVATPSPSSTAYQKVPTPIQLPVNNRRKIAPKPDFPVTQVIRPSNASPGIRPSVPSVVSNNTRRPIQVQRPEFRTVVGASQQQQQVQLTHHQQILPQQNQVAHNQRFVTQQNQTSHQQQAQSDGSKIIDLTDDDDRQAGQTGTIVRPTGSIRVINNLGQQPTTSQSNRFAYILPTTSTATVTPGRQAGRQVLIATPTGSQPNRQIVCSMPPLIFKGGSGSGNSPQTPPSNQSNKIVLSKPKSFLKLEHPAPLPQVITNGIDAEFLPPKPALKISRVQTGIVLSWNMTLGPEHAPIASYQLYAYQESNSPPTVSLWKKVGDVKALPLPMACTLTQFMAGHKYHFAVRAVDSNARIGPFSRPGTIVLV